MSAKEYLKQAFKAQERMAEIRGQIDQLREEMYRLSCAITEGSKVQTTPPRDPMGDRVAVIVDRISEREAQLARWGDLLYEVEGTLNDVECITCGKVLRARYVRGMTLEEVAVEMGYSHRYIQDLHATGLKEIKVPA